MNNIKVRHASDVHDESDLTPERMGIDGKWVFGGLVGFYIDAGCVCVDCAPVGVLNDGSIIQGNVEVDYPGHVCEMCHNPIPTRILIYETGPGEEIYEQH